MASPIDALQSAGYGTDEIAAWSQEKRSALSAAGFEDNEIDAYFTGGVVAPTKPPQSFIARVEKATAVFKKMHPIVAKGMEGVSEGFGDPTPTGFDNKTLNDLIDLGIFHDPDKGKPNALQFTAETLGIPSAQIVDRLLRSVSAGVHGAGAMVGAAIQEITGDETQGNQAKRETMNLANWAMIESGMGRFTRTRVTPTGAVDEVVGGLPKSDDFLTASRAVGDGTAPKPMQEKMLRTYEEKGVLPAELAHDAATDPIIAQRLLSKDPLDLPYNYLGESGYRFNAYDPLPGATKAAEESVDAMRASGLDASVREPYFQNPVGGRIKTEHPISRSGGEVENVGVSPVGEDFAIKPIEVKESLRDKVMLEGKDVPHSAAEEQILSKVSVGEKDTGRPLSWSRLYTDTIDDLHPLKAVSENAYELARLTRGQFGKSDYFLNHATFDFNTFKDNGKPLKEILAPVKNDLDGLRAYAVAERALEMEERGIKSGFDTGGPTAPPLISTGLEAARAVIIEGSDKFAKPFRELVDYQNRVSQYLRDSGIVSEEGYAALVEANQNYIPFFRVMNDGPKGKGPGAGSSLGPGDPLKRIKGSGRDVVDPLESIIKNTYAYISIAERNAAGIELIDALKAQGFKAETRAAAKVDPELAAYLKEQGVSEPGALAEFVQRGMADDGDVIRAYRNGVREEVAVNDPDLVAAFRGIDRQSVGAITRIFALPARALRTGSTMAPDFIARNLIRDFMTAFVNTKGIVFSPLDSLSGLKSVLTQDASWANWVKGGGANSTMVGLDRAYLQESLSKLSGETGLMERGWNVVTSPWRGLRMVSELIENATRVGEFKKAVQGPSKAEIQSAAFDAREVTLDFARMGAKMRAYNMVTAFANAQIQGVDRIVRAFAERPVNTSLKIAGGITMPSILLWWANHDDQRYQELPHWQKDLFWIIPTDKWEPIDAHDAAAKPSYLVREKGGKFEFNNGSIWRIPKPFELGVVFGSGVERVLEQTIGSNKDAYDSFSKSVVQAFTPNYIPTAIQPMIEQYANRSTFTDRTLIPADMEKHLPEYQYTPYTTQLSRKLGQTVSAFPGMREAATSPGAVVGPAARGLTSPILIENYIRSWTGGMGMYALQAADLSLRKAGVLPDPITPTPTLADIPFVKAFAVRYPSAGTQSIQDFYDEHEQQKRFFDTWMARAREGDVVAMGQIEAAGGPMMFSRLDAIKETLTEHSHLVRDIYKNPDMPAAEKRQLIDGYYYNMIEIGRFGMGALREMREKAADAVAKVH